MEAAFKERNDVSIWNLGADIVCRVVAGPKVDIYVGPKKKPYNLPRLLLCHCSPYFDHCFNGNFTERKTQKLKLPEDKVEDFEVLLEYMLRRIITKGLTVTEKRDLGIWRCTDFLEYADKYDMDEASTAIYEPLKEFLEHKTSPQQITPTDIEAVFRVALKDCPLRTLIARGALVVMGGFRSDAFKKQEREVDGFAVELLDQIRLCARVSIKWVDPFA